MQPITFSAVRDLLKEQQPPDPKLIDAVDSLLGAVFLLVPPLIGMSPEAVTAAIGLIGAKNELVKMGKALYKHLSKPRADDPITRERRMASAFYLCAYVAFFEALSKATPEISKIVDLSHLEKCRLLQSAGELNVGGLSSVEELSNTPSGPGVELPHPAETFEQVTAKLMPIYTHLAKGVARLVEAFEPWDSLNDEQRRQVKYNCDRLPMMASQHFRAQYFDLASRFGEFAVWSNLREHAATHSQIGALSASAQHLLTQLSAKENAIDLGLKKLRDMIESLPKAVGDYQAVAVWKDLGRHYRNAIAQPIIKDPVAEEDTKPNLKYPSRSEIFVPQSFKVIRYSRGGHLEDESTWKSAVTRRDLGDFVSTYLQSPYSSRAPLIILGQPGSGKSLLSQMIAAQIDSTAFAPIRLELRGINADSEIEVQIEEQVRRDTARSVQFSSLMDSLGGRPAVVIFDGYDELLQATGQVFAGYLTKVQKFQEREQSLERNAVRTIVTSRITLIDKAVIPEGSTVLRLLEFDKDQQNEWISVWNRANSAFFQNSRVAPFALPDAPKLAEIAEQPLLLLMLALYDSTANQLSSAPTLDQTVLYNSLLRRFIVRERGKDEEFRDLPERDKTIAVNREMRRLGVAAIGMFSRHALHIRAAQLNSDLEFLSLTRNIPAGSGRQLSQAELVLGSFFFVHQSTAQQRGDSGEDRESDTAFEFLHNTFGEFLTGHFLVSELLTHTNSLYKLRSDPALGPIRLKTLTDRDGFPSSWYASLMHAALFARPVIVTMIREWIKHAVKDFERELDDFLPDFDDILFYEVQRAITGREFPSIMIGKQTSFEPLPLLGYLANYTLNLVTLRVAISEEGFIFDESRFATADRRARVWDRIANLWKSWFSLDALNGLNTIFTAEREEEKVHLRRSQSRSLPVAGGRIETIANVALAVGDNVDLALSGVMMYGATDQDSVPLNRARSAAAAESLGIEVEILIREVWLSSRTKPSASVRRVLFERCMAAFEQDGGLDIGRAIDLVRAYRNLGDAMLFRQLAWKLIEPFERGRGVFRPGAIRGLSIALELWAEIDEQFSLPPLDLSIPDQNAPDELSSLLRELSANAVAVLLSWDLPRNSDMVRLIAEMLYERTRDEDFLSTLSPPLALALIRALGRQANALRHAVRSNILGYFVSPEQILAMPPEAAVGMLEISSRLKFRTVLERFFDSLAISLGERLDSRPRRSSYRYPSFSAIEQDLGAAVLRVATKYASSESKATLYRFAMEYWMRSGRLRLLASVIRFSREMDGGKLFLDFLRQNQRPLFRGTERWQIGPAILGSIAPLPAFKKLPRVAVREFIWLATAFGDHESVERLSKSLGQEDT